MLKKLTWALVVALTMAIIPMGIFAEEPVETFVVSVQVDLDTEVLFFDANLEIGADADMTVLDLLLFLEMEEMLGDEELSLQVIVNSTMSEVDLAEFVLEDGDYLLVSFNSGTVPTEDFEDLTLDLFDITTIEPVEMPVAEPVAPAAPQPIPAYVFGDLMDYYVTGPVFGIFVDRYGGTLWFEGDFIMPELAAFPLDDDTVLVPFRDVVEGLLAGQVYWDIEGRHVTAQAGGVLVGFSLDGASIPVVVINDRIYVPAEAIEEFFLER